MKLGLLAALLFFSIQVFSIQGNAAPIELCGTIKESEHYHYGLSKKSLIFIPGKGSQTRLASYIVVGANHDISTNLSRIANSPPSVRAVCIQGDINPSAWITVWRAAAPR